MPRSARYEAEGRDAVAAIRKALCALGLESGTPPPACSSDHKNVLVAAAAAVSSEATKVRRGWPLQATRIALASTNERFACLFKHFGRREIGVVWKDGGAMLEVDVATSSIDALVVSCVALGAFADQAYPVAGTSLITAVRAGMAEIGEAVAALVTGACGTHHDDDGAAPALPALVGVVWERCEAVAKLPKDNRAAVGRALAKVAVQVKDVVREMDEIDTSAAAVEGNTANGASCSDDDDEDDDLDFDVEFESDDVVVLEAAKPVFASALGLMRSTVRVLAEGAEPSDEEEAALLERALVGAQASRAAVEALGAAIYPPQEVDQLRKHRADLETAAAAMVEALAARGGGSGGGTALEEPAMALTDACTALGEVLSVM